MRALLLVVPLAACTVAPFEVTLRNDDDATRFVVGYDAPLLSIEERRAGEYRWTASSQAWMCLPVCGTPSPIVCADVAPPGSVWAIAPGESVALTIEGERWVAMPTGFGSSCAERTSLGGALRLSICHGTEAQIDGEPVVAAETGLVQGSEFGFADLPSSNCSSIDVQLSGDRAVVLPLTPEL